MEVGESFVVCNAALIMNVKFYVTIKESFIISMMGSCPRAIVFNWLVVVVFLARMYTLLRSILV